MLPDLQVGDLVRVRSLDHPASLYLVCHKIYRIEQIVPKSNGCLHCKLEGVDTLQWHISKFEKLSPIEKFLYEGEHAT